MRLFPIVGIALLAGCVTETPDVGPAAGRMAFSENCAGCHGPEGRGDGEYARAMSKAPPDLTLLAERNGGTFPRDRVMSVIDGYARGAHFAPEMPEFGAGDMGDTVVVEETPGIGTPVPSKLLALTNYLETIQR